MSDSIENEDGSLFLDVDEADLHRYQRDRLARIDAALPKIVRAAERAQIAAGNPDRWRDVCAHLAEARRLIAGLTPD